MTELQDALKTYESERDWNAGRIPDYVHPLASAARGLLPKHAIVIEGNTIEEVLGQMRALVANQKGWEADSEDEGGQPNGIGEIEDNYSREWFNPDNETHHRQAWSFHGPWVEGPTEEVREKREKEAARQAKLAEERAAAKKEAEPDETLTDVARGLYGAHRLTTGLATTQPWGSLPAFEKDLWLMKAQEAVKEN